MDPPLSIDNIIMQDSEKNKEDNAEAESDDKDPEEEEIRGQKRSLDETTTSNQDANNKSEIPDAVHVTWEGHDAILTIDCKDASEESRICFVGRAKLKCLKGSLHILGHEMKKSINEHVDESDEVLLTSPFWSSWTTIQATSPGTQFRLISVRGTPSFRLTSPSRRPTIIPDSWKTTVDQIVTEYENSPLVQRDSLEDDGLFVHDKPQVILICGGKGVGKSTLLRYMTNRLLSCSNGNHDSQQVAIIDADVGQPELVPPAMLSLSIQKRPLVQTPYWNITEPIESIASVFFGAFSSKVDPTRYINAVQYLVQKYREFLPTSPMPTPLLINMDGWIKGLGYEILTALISSISPSHICQVLGETKAKTFDLQNICSGKESNIFFLDACTNLIPMSCSIPSFTLRSLRLGAYFGPHLADLWDTLDFTPAKQLQAGWVDEGCVLAEYLAKERPYCVPFEAVTCSLIGPGQHDVRTETRILQAMNGSIIGLCVDDANGCLGLGLVRSIDWNRRLFYVLTPVEESLLPRVNSLVGGNMPLPVSFFSRGVNACSFPYQSMPKLTQGSSVALGVDPMKSRNNISRKGSTN